MYYSELNELIALQKKFESSFHQTLLRGGAQGASSLPAGRAASPTRSPKVSLYHNVLSPPPGTASHSAVPSHSSRGPTPRGGKSGVAPQHQPSTGLQASRSGGSKQRSVHADHSKLPSHASAPIGAPTPPTLTPHNNQASSRAPLPPSDRDVYARLLSTQNSYATQATRTNSGAHRGALDASIFDLMHPHQHLRQETHVASAHSSAEKQS